MMRCKVCRQPMRPEIEAQVPLIIALLFAAAGVAGGGFLVTRHMLPIAGALAIVGALGGVLLASLRRNRWVCISCGNTDALDELESAQVEADEKAHERERVRVELMMRLQTELQPQIAEQLRPRLEQELRPQIEDDLRPRLAEELREQFEEELRPRLVEEVRSQVEREVEVRLRAEIEKQMRSAMARPAAAGPPAQAQAPARSAPLAAAPAQAVRRSSSSPSIPAVGAPTAPQPAQASRAVPGLSGLAPVGAVADPHARAQRRARVIVSDIALYHKDMIASAAQSSDPKRAMATVWEEAVRSYNESVSDEVRRNTNYLGDAFDALIQKMRREINAS